MIRSGLSVLAALVALAATVVALSAAAVAEPTPASVPALSKYNPVTPVRVLDTRTGLGAPAGRTGAGGTVTVHLAGRLPRTATAVVLTLTGTQGAGSSQISVSQGAGHGTRNLNVEGARTVTTQVVREALHLAADRRTAELPAGWNTVAGERDDLVPLPDDSTPDRGPRCQRCGQDDVGA